MSSRKEVAMSRLQSKLSSALDSGDYYHAHQLYRTLYFRLTAKESWSELLELLHSGATSLLARGELLSGADLCNLYLESLPKVPVSPSESTVVTQVESLLTALLKCEAGGSATPTGGPEESSSVLQAFESGSIKWSRTVHPDMPNGHPGLHKALAAGYWSAKHYDAARRHFILSQDGEGCAAFLIEYHCSRGFASEVDLFLAQGVLQFLCHQNERTATVLFTQYTSRHPSLIPNSGPPFGRFPLLNFIWLLLACIERKAQLTQFSILVEKYRASIYRDPCYPDLVDRIGQLFFGLPPPQAGPTGPGGMFQNILKGLLKGSDDEDEDMMVDESEGPCTHHHKNEATSCDMTPGRSLAGTSSMKVQRRQQEEDLD